MKTNTPPVILSHTSTSESWLKTAKLSALSSATLRLRRSSSRTSSMAFGTSACEVALMLIQLSFNSGWSLWKVV